MMSSKRFILFTILLFIVGALPFIIAQPSAAASAGLTLGFSAPFDHLAIALLVMTAGTCAALLPRDGLMLMPVAFALMGLVGGVLSLDVSDYPALRYFVLGAILCMGLLVAIAREKLTVLTLLILASLGFHLGGFFMDEVPSIASPMYFLLGVLLSLGMLLAISVAFAVTLIGDNEATWNRIKQSPRVAFIRSIFL